MIPLSVEERLLVLDAIFNTNGGYILSELLGNVIWRMEDGQRRQRLEEIVERLKISGF